MTSTESQHDVPDGCRTTLGLYVTPAEAYGMWVSDGDTVKILETLFKSPARHSLTAALILAATACSFAARPATAAEKPRPNVLFITTDDLNWDSPPEQVQELRQLIQAETSTSRSKEWGA